MTEENVPEKHIQAITRSYQGHFLWMSITNFPQTDGNSTLTRICIDTSQVGQNMRLRQQDGTFVEVGKIEFEIVGTWEISEFFNIIQEHCDRG